MKHKENADNFLEYIPVKKAPYDKQVQVAKEGPGFMVGEDGMCVLVMENNEFILLRDKQ